MPEYNNLLFDYVTVELSYNKTSKFESNYIKLSIKKYNAIQ